MDRFPQRGPRSPTTLRNYKANPKPYTANRTRSHHSSRSKSKCQRYPPARSTQGPSWGYLKVNSSETLSIFGDKCPQNGSKNEEMAPRTKTGYPHIGPFVASWSCMSGHLTRNCVPSHTELCPRSLSLFSSSSLLLSSLELSHTTIYEP